MWMSCIDKSVFEAEMNKRVTKTFTIGIKYWFSLISLEGDVENREH